MKTIFTILFLITCLNLSANDACTSYANLSSSILNQIEAQKIRDQKQLDFEFHKAMRQCSNELCFQQAKEQYSMKNIELIENEKNAILEAYQNLARNCSN